MRCLTGILVLGFCFAVFAAGCNKEESALPPDGGGKSNTGTDKNKPKGKGLPAPPKIE
jgi:hypothetical protein